MLLPSKWTSKRETRSSSRSMNGIKLNALRYGVSDQKPQDPTSCAIRPKEPNILMKSKTQWKLHSNGPPKNQSWLKRTWEVLDSTFSMSYSMLMPSTEVVDKSSPLPEESTTLLSWLPNQDSKNPSSCVKSKHLMMLWEVSINALPQEEVSLLEKSQLMELHSLSLELTCQSLSHSGSPNIWENSPQEEPSHNACSTIGNNSLMIHLIHQPSQDNWSNRSERERVSSQAFLHSKTSPTSFEPTSNYYFA